MFLGKILVVDDDKFFRTLCSDVLRSGGFLVETAASGLEAVDMVASDEFDVVITDLVMPDMNGLEVLERVKQINTLIDVVMVTGYGSIESAIIALKKGAFDYIRKPLNEDELIHTVRSCIEKKALLEENQEMRLSLRLFEVTRAVATTLDVNRLYDVAIDALLQIIPSTAGILAFHDENSDDLEIKSLRHLDMKKAEEIVAAFSKRLAGDARIKTGVTVLSSEELGATPADFSSVLSAPVTRGVGASPTGAGAAGFMLILSDANKEVFGAREVKNASFISEHASLAFENATRFAAASEMAYIDSLTNLHNSKYLSTALENEIKRAERLMTPVTVLFIDIDNFKQVNDANDHIVGSKVLVEVGKILQHTVREVDTVVRYGGDEYVVILIDADYNTGYHVADRIREAIAEHKFLGTEGLNLHITASIGVATYPEHTKDKNELLKIADRAMYRAKDISRNTVYLAPLPGAQH